MTLAVKGSLCKAAFEAAQARCKVAMENAFRMFAVSDGGGRTRNNMREERWRDEQDEV